MPRRDRRRGKNDDMGESSWMDTYADTITLLLTFFILLYSM
ncbi:MAG: flagellar motor protein MotB, partial [Paeniclostridium sp.]